MRRLGFIYFVLFVLNNTITLNKAYSSQNDYPHGCMSVPYENGPISIPFNKHISTTKGKDDNVLFYVTQKASEGGDLNTYPCQYRIHPKGVRVLVTKPQGWTAYEKKFDIPKVLIANETCSSKPNLFFIAHDEIQPRRKEVGKIFTASFYAKPSNIPSKSFLGGMYQEVYKAGSNIIDDNSYNIYPHQFFIRSGYINNYNATNAVVYDDIFHSPDNLEINIIRSLQTIQAECGKIPKSFSINGVVYLDRTYTPVKEFKVFFEGRLDLNFNNTKDVIKIIPNKEYDTFNGGFHTLYNQNKQNYARLRKINRNSGYDPNKAALGAAALIGLFALGNATKDCETRNDDAFICDED